MNLAGKLPDLSDADLNDLRVAILTEQERRQRLATTPALIQQMAAAYVADGGAIGDLTTVVADV